MCIGFALYGGLFNIQQGVRSWKWLKLWLCNTWVWRQALRCMDFLHTTFLESPVTCMWACLCLRTAAKKASPLFTTFKQKQFFKSKNVGAIWQAVVFWKNSVHVMDWLTYFYTWFTFELSGEFWGQSWSRVDHAIIKVVIVWCHIGCSCSSNVSRVFT